MLKSNLEFPTWSQINQAIDNIWTLTLEDMKCPGSFVWVGGAMPDPSDVYPHHHPKFNVDEEAMLRIGKLFIGTVLDYLEDGAS